jgi:N-acetylmuramoyl-L-alanine amidase
MYPKKMRSFSTLISLLLFPSLLFALPMSTAPLRVMIDPGHGGTDSGAVYGRAREADIVLKVSLALKELMQQKNSGFEPLLTRTSDRNLALPSRVSLAEKENVDLFVSIHANASKDQRAHGVEFYFQNQLPADEDSMFLANLENQHDNSPVPEAVSEELSAQSDVQAIVADLHRTHKMHQSHELSLALLNAWQPNLKDSSHVIRQAPFYVISKTRIPSVLVELGFISNAKESERLLKPAYQKEIAERIFAGLTDYKEKVDKAQLSSLH